MRAFDLREAGMYAVRTGAARIFKAEAAEQSIGLNHVFERFRHIVALYRHERALAVGHKYIIALAGDRHTGAAAAVPGSDEVHTFGGIVCHSLKIGCKRIADTGREQPRGGVGYYLGVYKHELGRAAHLFGADMHAVLGIQDGNAGCRSVR